jgi:hypothetical protein
MKEINGYLIVPVPEWAKQHGLDTGSTDENMAYVIIGGPGQYKVEELPEGDWSIVEIDERVAGEIVEDYFSHRPTGPILPMDVFRNYVVEDGMPGSWNCETALESYSSLLRSKGYEKAILLKKK